jgi:hypothetical protein
MTHRANDRESIAKDNATPADKEDVTLADYCREFVLFLGGESERRTAW